MKKYFTLFIFLMLGISLHAFDFSGIFNYSKGLNKPNGTLCIFQIQSDTAFFYMSNMSGAPDFNLTNLKGFFKIDSNSLFYHKDSCKISCQWTNGIMSVVQMGNCKYDFTVEGKYKKNGTSMKRPNTWMTEYTEKAGVICVDTAVVYFAPHVNSKQILILKKETPLKVMDEVNGFYLIEIPKQKNEFLWTQKKNVLLNKK